jgi:dTDP-4-dehydrorhamnose reductase
MQQKMKVAIIGSNGQLGSDLVKVFSQKHEVIALNHSDIEVTNIDSVKSTLNAIKPSVVINTSAYHNVPLCEQNQDMAFSVNGKGALNLAKICTDINARFVHYSTDYVFDGAKKQPYIETDYCNPLNVYAVTKLAGENFALNYASQPYVIRVSGIYGSVPCRAKGGNFITTMLKLAKEKPEVKVVDDEILTPTPTMDIAENTLQLVSKDAYGLFHMTCEGQCSWYEFAKTIWEVLQLKTPLYPTTVKEFAAPVKRPFYSVLENSHLKAINCNFFKDWKTSLIQFLNNNSTLTS